MARQANDSRNGAVTIGATAVQIVAVRAERRSVVIRNNHVSNILYIGDDSTVTAANGFPLEPGEFIEFDDFGGPVYAIASAAGTDVRYLEVGG